MYRLACREIGIDCDFVIQSSEGKVICDTFNQHITAKHNRRISKRDIRRMMENKNKEQHPERKSYRIDESELLKLEKWSLGRRNFS